MTQIRVASPDDIPGVAAVTRAAYQEFAPVLGADYPGYLASLLDIEARLATGTVLVAESGGRIAGTATLYLDAARAVGRALAVDPGSRGHGVARALLEDVVARAMRSGADELCLHTAEFMTTAVALYEAHGFRRDPVRDREAASDFALIAYRLRLTGGRPAIVHRLPTGAPWPARRHGAEILTPVWLAGR